MSGYSADWLDRAADSRLEEARREQDREWDDHIRARGERAVDRFRDRAGMGEQANPYIVTPEEWKRRVCAGGCAFHDNPDDCEWPLQGAHIISQQTLRRHGFNEHLWDVRNGVGACYRAHRRSDNAVERFPVGRLPAAVWDFAAELGLTWKLTRIYGERKNAA